MMSGGQRTRIAERSQAMKSGRGFERVGMWLAAGLLIVQAGGAQASSFSVSPTQVFLSASVKSALVTIKNETDQSVRFQVSAVAWDQDEAGRMQVMPTQDIVFFPSLLTLQAREERKIRLGTTVAASAREKTYRLVVEELPPLQTANSATAVAMLTKMTIPVFLQPTRVVGQASLADVGMSGGHLVFRLRNDGTAHFVPQQVRVKGLDESGTAVVDQQATAWYILAGGTRHFDLEISQPQCSKVRTLAIAVQVGDKTLTETVRTPNGACAG
jgi:fimbrial chaperone protein